MHQPNGVRLNQTNQGVYMLKGSTTLTLVVILTIALVLGIAGLGKKLADAKVRDIQKTIEQQVQERE